ncbi:MAG: tandem-95 repeat protein, partial [Acidimicrobiia bacterium]|nr:tandem-95 repeat protein [Acidimicrobiia bacterium]
VGAQEANEGTPFSVTVSATDPDGDSLVLTAVGLPAWASMVDNGDGTATISGTPSFTDAGVSTVDVTADDGTDTATTSFDLTVSDTNQVPVWSPVGSQEAHEGTPFSVTVSATDPDGDSLVLTASGLPTWATMIDHGDNTATISGTPGYFDSGASSIVLTASDGTDEAGVSFELVVSDVLRPPTAVDDVGQVFEDAQAGVLIDVLANDDDPDGDALVISVFDSTTTMGGTVTSSGNQLLYRPAPEFSGADWFSYTIADGTGGFASAKVAMTVIAVNDPPVIGPIGDQLVAVGQSVDVQIVAWDLDSDVLTFSVSGLADAQIDASGHFTWVRPAGLLPGLYTVTVQVGDGVDTTSSFFGINVVAEPVPLPSSVDQPLVFPAPAAIEVDEDQPVELTFVARDPDDQEAEIRYQLVEGPSGASLDGFSGLLSWAPQEEDGPGVFVVSVQAISSNDERAQTSTAITVREVNSAPTLALSADRAVEAGARLVMTFAADDSDIPANAVRFGLVGLIPPGARIDPFTGVLTWNVEESSLDHGIHKMTISATDEGGLTSTTDVTVRVIAAGTIAKRGLLVDAVQASASGVANPTTDPESGAIVRTLVVLGEAGSYTVRMLRIPLLMVAALILLFGTIGKVTVGTTGARVVETGTVDWFDESRGFGYIRPDSGEPPVFVHENALRRRQRSWFVPGASVKYRAIAGSNRAFVRWVRSTR